jgi:putative modified peptide
MQTVTYGREEPELLHAGFVTRVPETGRFCGFRGIGMIATSVTAPLDAAIADRLLDLLSTDDLFRERFQRDHIAALRSIGHESPSPGAMTACGLLPEASTQPFEDCKVTRLAPKQVIAAARGEIRAMLLKGLNQTVPQLDVGLPTGNLVRR